MSLEDILDQKHAQPHNYKRHYGRIGDIKCSCPLVNNTALMFISLGGMMLWKGVRIGTVG